MAVYRKTTWVNENPPPINDVNLNHAESGTVSASNDIRDIGLGTTVIAEAEVCGTTDFIAHASETVIGGVKVHTVTDSITGEITGFIDSGTVADEPTAVIDFNASDRLPGIVRLSFTEHLDTMWYDLYVGDTLVAPDVGDGYEYLTEAGTWNFHLVANNAFGTANSNIDSGTAYAVPTDVPADILDFAATDDEVQTITFTWTDNGDAVKFDVYSGVTVVAQNANSGDSVAIVEGTANYFTRATNSFGTTDSNTDDGTSLNMTPSAITDFAATDAVVGGEEGRITMTFTNVSQPATYDLYKDGALIRNGIHDGYVLTTTGGTNLYKVKAINPVGETFSNEDSGTAIPAEYPPDVPLNFTASDDGRRSITINFLEATGAEQYDLYRSGVLFTTDVYPGFQFASVEGEWEFFVRASNLVGHNDSNVDLGKALAAFTVAPDPVNDLIVSTDLEATLLVTFTELDNTTRFDLYRDGEPYKSDVYTGMLIPSFPGEWQFYIVSSNPIDQHVEGNTVTGSVTESGNAPTWPTDDFTAIDGANLITMVWTPAVGASRYDLYKDGVKIREDVISPYGLGSPVGEWWFSVKAVNLVDSTESRLDEGEATQSPQPPSEILDFEASDNLTESVFITFTDADYAIYYTLYRADIPFAFEVHSGDTIPCDVGTWEFFVAAHNNLGDVPSNPNSGTSVAKLAPPSYINDFEATTDELNQVTMTFTAATGVVDNHALYKNGARIEENISTGFIHYTTNTTPADYYVKAENKDGFMDSNHWTGNPVAVLPSYVIVGFGVYEYVGDNPVDPIYLENPLGDPPEIRPNTGYGTFTVPEHVTEISICMCGAGSGGRAYDGIGSTTNHGGQAGDDHSETRQVTPGTVYSFQIGLRGINFLLSPDGGGPTIFDDLSVAGGPVSYYGNGAEKITCAGTFYDGTYSDGGDIDYYGGEASMFGDGGDGRADSDNPGGPCAGGGGGGGYNLSGGDGRVRITWG